LATSGLWLESHSAPQRQQLSSCTAIGAWQARHNLGKWRSRTRISTVDEATVSGGAAGAFGRALGVRLVRAFGARVAAAGVGAAGVIARP
jgi:hypothetical protein